MIQFCGFFFFWSRCYFKSHKRDQKAEIGSPIHRGCWDHSPSRHVLVAHHPSNTVLFPFSQVKVICSRWGYVVCSGRKKPPSSLGAGHGRAASGAKGQIHVRCVVDAVGAEESRVPTVQHSWKAEQEPKYETRRQHFVH